MRVSLLALQKIICFLIVHIGSFAHLVTHKSHDKTRREYANAWAIAHKHGIHIEIGYHTNAEKATMVGGIGADKLLRGMNRFGLDVLALLCVSPKGDENRTIANVLAHSYHVVEEMRGIKLRILTKMHIAGFYGLNAIKGKIVEYEILGFGSEKEPTIAKLLEQVGKEYIFNRFARRERLILIRSVCL